MPAGNPFPVAIVGIAAELPSGKWSESNFDYISFYEFLLQGGEAYERIPLERFNVQTGRASGQVVTDSGAFLKNIDLFDPVEFGITSKDARLMNLGTRKLIETTFLALLDSGLDYRGRNVGCYMSAVAHDMFSVSGHDDTEARGAFSYGPAMVANRVSYHLDLRGPSLPLDTACSSTLYATHLGVQALRNGECEAAVVGGCQLNHRFTEWLLYSQGGILSPDGKCKPFDVSANGFGRGEAAVSIVLKPLDAALRDRDRIYATILGTGINSSGSLAPVNAPVASAQQDAMFRAFAQAQRSPRDVDFIELHATGTASGDPTEANWAGVQFRRDAELLVGSVKGNVGHTEITAFLSSLCKVCHIIEHGVIPPTVNFSVPNPAIRWKEHNMRVPVAPENLSIRSPSGRALIAMSSSGIGGANGHCVIEAHASNTDGVPRMWSCERSIIPSLLIAGGLSPRSTSAVGESLKSISADRDRTRVGRALGRRVRSMLWKAYSVTPEGQIPRFSEPVLTPKVAPEVVFVFSGQGPQHWNMGRELFGTCVPFHDTVVELDQVYAAVTGKSLIKDIGLFDESGIPDTLGDVWPISITLPALTILQIALVDTLAAIGIKPDVVVGHSAGETAVVYASGAASKAMAVELSIARGEAMATLEAHDGTMAAVACSAVRAKEIIDEVVAELGPAALEVACFNAPNAVTLSGSTKHVVSAVARAKAAGILATRLRTRIPVHSSMMTLCQAEYEGRVEEVFKKYAVEPTKVEAYSALSGDMLTTSYDARYFWDNTVGPVMFDPAVKSIRNRHPQAIFVELGPHPVLSGYITAIAGQGSTVLSPLKRSKSSEVGYTGVDMDVLYGTAESAGAAIPPYPFARKEVPYVAQTLEITRQRQARHGPLNYRQLRINTQTHPGLADHVIKNEPIMPAAGFLEMALEFGAKRLWDVQFHSMLSLSAERPTPVDVKLEGSRWSVRSVAATDYANTWPPTYNRLHATGYLSTESELDADGPAVSLDDIRARLKKMEMKGFYEHLDSFANYGPTYRRVLSCYHGIDASGLEELLIEIRGAGDDLENLSEYRLHPAILDAALHVAVHPLITGAIAQGRYYLPAKVGTGRHDAADVESTVIVDGSPKDLNAKLRIFRYHRGGEMSLQQAVGSLNPSDRELLCFITAEGLDGDAILGFTRSLRKEYRSWRVFCVVFPSSWPFAELEETARSLCAHPLAEDEMLVQGDRSVCVARVVPSSAPKQTVSFDPEAPWLYQKHALSQVPKPAIPSGHIFLRVVGTSSDSSSCRAFIGRTDASSTTYIGITFGPLSNYVVAHRGSLLELTNVQDTDRGPHALAAVIAVLAIGHARFSDPSRLEASCILVTHSDTEIGHGVCQLYESRGFHVARLPSQAIIVSGRQRIAANDIDETVTRLQAGTIYQWNDPSTGVAQTLDEDPWAVGDALKLALSDPADFSEVFAPPIELLGIAPPVEVPSLLSIFDQDKSYILVGGIGGLGLHIASWMYKNGAREIILTSRSGTANLVPKDEFIALRLLEYLRSREDLVLRTEAVDASSVEQTKELVASIQKPVGGCMILTAVLIDRTFPMQTAETFEAPFTAKLGAFNALEKAVDIDSLDFVLAYSSIAGLSGNAGQTNYSSANTALTGLTRRYRNAVTIVPPLINDTGVFLTMAATDSTRWSRYRHLSSWAMTSAWQYIPDFDWSLVQSNLGSSPLYDHLVIKASSSDTDQTSSDDLGRSLSDIICDVLDIDPEDLSADVPLTSYGLDSLSAAALSHALEPYVAISQLQLLADVTLGDLEDEKVFAIVRRDVSGTSAKDRLLNVFNARELDAATLTSDKLAVLEGDLSEPRFGLSTTEYDELLSSVTHIVHLAWPIDFVTPLSAFEPHIRGIRYMIDFAAVSDAHVKLLFSSTAGMFRRLSDHKPVAEVLVEDPTIAVGSGYPESKWVAERLVTFAAAKNILSPTIDVSWLPVDAAAAAVVDFTDSSEKVLHLRHPQPVTWPEVFNQFASVLNLPLAPYSDWITRLERGLVSTDETDATRYLQHGLRLLDIFRLASDPDEPRPDVMGKLVPHIDITHGLEASATLREGKVAKIGVEDVRRWVDYWRKEAFIPAAVPGAEQ
ncbi:putative polyketide synthase [Fomitopsis serialis]|uniref:putative polyketide synthase n=1 Tax=Fomitopsis serialis TaxID=139415 RepID=UPI0020077F06|nr:putative polyketide synthase [Neoantrodia serialis]KAH9934268.1 putative polyketide synthase [Neoantrodia serialis]